MAEMAAPPALGERARRLAKWTIDLGIKLSVTFTIATSINSFFIPENYRRKGFVSFIIPVIAAFFWLVFESCERNRLARVVPGNPPPPPPPVPPPGGNAAPPVAALGGNAAPPVAAPGGNAAPPVATPAPDGANPEDPSNGAPSGAPAGGETPSSSTYETASSCQGELDEMC